MKKIITLISVILIFFIIYVLVLLIPKNYSIIYNKGDFQITEQYNKSEKKYFFEIKYKSINYPLLIEKDYSRKRKIIDDITVNEIKEERCLNIIIDKKKYRSCSNNNDLRAFNTMSEDFLKNNYNIEPQKNSKIDEYKKINIYNKNHKYYIWNYKGFYLIDPTTKKKIDIVNKDNYKNYLTYQTDKYLIIPNYDQEYFYTKIYLLNTENNKIDTIELEYEVSIDSYFIGNYNDKVYFIDKKGKIEYELNLKNKKIKIVSKDNDAIYYDGKEMINTSLNKLINEEKVFNYENIYNYILDNNTLYLKIKDYKIKVSNLKVNKIVSISNDKIYYLSKNKLYEYQYNGNENLLLEYNEWNFNYNNHIFIFN